MLNNFLIHIATYMQPNSIESAFNYELIDIGLELRRYVVAKLINYVGGRPEGT